MKDDYFEADPADIALKHFAKLDSKLLAMDVEDDPLRRSLTLHGEREVRKEFDRFVEQLSELMDLHQRHFPEILYLENDIALVKKVVKKVKKLILAMARRRCAIERACDDVLASDLASLLSFGYGEVFDDIQKWIDQVLHFLRQGSTTGLANGGFGSQVSVATSAVPELALHESVSLSCLYNLLEDNCEDERDCSGNLVAGVFIGALLGG